MPHEIALLARGQIAFACADSLDLQIADVAQGRRLRIFPVARERSRENVSALAASPTEIVSGANGSIRVWQVNGGRQIRELLPEDGSRVVRHLARFEDGSIAAAIIPDRVNAATVVELHHWSSDGKQKFGSKLATAQPSHQPSVGGIARAADGRIATGVDQIVVLDGKSGAPIGTPFGMRRESDDSIATLRAVGWVGGEPVGVSAAGHIGDPPSTIHVVARQRTHQFADHRGAMQDAAFLGDGRFVTAGHKDRRVVVRDRNGLAQCELTGAPDTIWSLGVSADAAFIAVGTPNQIVVWDLAGCVAR